MVEDATRGGSGMRPVLCAAAGRVLVRGAFAAATLVGGVTVTGLGANGVGASAPPSPRAAVHTPPRCARRMIFAAARRDRALGPVTRVGAFACVGSWAYAGITVGSIHGFDAVIVLHARAGRWVVADRARACTRHRVPQPLFKRACTTS